MSREGAVIWSYSCRLPGGACISCRAICKPDLTFLFLISRPQGGNSPREGRCRLWGVMYQEEGIWATPSCNLCAFTDWWVQSVHIPLPFDHGVSATTWANFVTRQVRQHRVDDESSSRMVFSELMVKCSVATKCYFSKWGWLSSENSKISSQYPKGLCCDSSIRAAKVSKQHLHLLLTLQDPSDLLGHRVQMQEQPGPEELSLFFFSRLYITLEAFPVTQ